MPSKKAPARKSKPAAPKARKAATGQFDSLRKTVTDLRTRLEKELKARKIEARILAEARKAREQLNSQVKVLRQQGSKLAGDLKSALSDSKQYEKARAQAHKKIDQLKSELSAKTGELMRKSEELKKLAEESAHRAAEIIRREEQTQAEPVSEAAAPEAPEPALAETEDPENKNPFA
jgi:chromosome segregation ATPase